MVQSCAAINCTRRRNKGVKIKFPRFPKDCNMRKAWIQAMRRDNYKPGEWAVICEAHFVDEDYIMNVHGNKILKKGAIPSIFDFPPHLQKLVKKRRILQRDRKETETLTNADQNLQPNQSTTILMEIDLNSDIVDQTQRNLNEVVSDSVSSSGVLNQTKFDSSSQQQQTVARNRRDPIYFGDFKEGDLTCPVKRKRFFKIASETVCRYKTLIKYYQCKNRRHKKKISDLSSVLNDLIEKEKISSDQFLVLQVSVAYSKSPTTYCFAFIRIHENICFLKLEV